MGFDEARRLALDVSYGRHPIDIEIAGDPGRSYELGPEVPEEDIDGRAAAVVAWASGDRFHLVASSELERSVLIEIAESLS